MLPIETLGFSSRKAAGRTSLSDTEMLTGDIRFKSPLHTQLGPDHMPDLHGTWNLQSAKDLTAKKEHVLSRLTIFEIPCLSSLLAVRPSKGKKVLLRGEPGSEAGEGNRLFPVAPRDHSERQVETGTTSPRRRGVPPSQPGGARHIKPCQRERPVPREVATPQVCVRSRAPPNKIYLCD